MDPLIAKTESTNSYFVSNRHILMVDSINIHNDYRSQNQHEPTLLDTNLYLTIPIFNFKKANYILLQFKFKVTNLLCPCLKHLC